MNNVSISQLNPAIGAFKTTSVRTNAYLKYRRKRSKIYARLKRFKESLGLSTNRVPFGITAGANGVVTFKKIDSTSPMTNRTDQVNPRKRKIPGEVPHNPSSTAGDKIRQGVVPPVGNMLDHPLSNNTDPNDKGLYENLPFHGIQNPPNKPFRPDPCDLIYADVDYKSNYGPINYKAASIYAALKRKDNKMQPVDKEDLL